MKKASVAERASIKYKQVEYMQQFLGTEMEGTIVSMTDWGIYIELMETKCEGMARLSDIEGDFYQYNPELQQVVGINYGASFKLGDQIRVVISKADPVRRELDLEVISA